MCNCKESEHYCRKCGDYIAYGRCYFCIKKDFIKKNKVREVIKKYIHPVMYKKQETMLKELGL